MTIGARKNNDLSACAGEMISFVMTECVGDRLQQPERAYTIRAHPR